MRFDIDTLWNIIEKGFPIFILFCILAIVCTFYYLYREYRLADLFYRLSLRYKKKK